MVHGHHDSWREFKQSWSKMIFSCSQIIVLERHFCSVTFCYITISIPPKQKAAKEFEVLTEEESKRRLSVIIKKVDANNDSYIDNGK